MNDTLFGELSVIAMKGCEEFGTQVDYYLRWRAVLRTRPILSGTNARASARAKQGLIFQSMRGHDLYIICDVFNHGVTYNMYGKTVPMSPDDHYADLKRLISAAGGKARRVSVIMPMLYEADRTSACRASRSTVR